MLIEFKWGIVKEYTMKKLLFPFFVYMLVFMVYKNFIMEPYYLHTPLSDFTALRLVFMIIFQVLLLGFSAYFLENEYKQVKEEGAHYFLQVWNYIDIISPVMIVLQMILMLVMDFQPFMLTMNAIASLFMWFKFLYFLRIFKMTSYLVQLVIQVIYDMQGFMIVLLITIMAFSDAFLSISLGN